MKLQDLRIGNYITANGKEINVGHIQDNFYGALINGNGVDTGIYEPIPLNEEWLLKFGFEKSNNLDCWYNVRIRNDWTRLNVNIKHEMSEIDINRHCCVLGQMKYVHQLQNLYFALTGSELAIAP